jgi:hypothetical protein
MILFLVEIILFLTFQKCVLLLLTNYEWFLEMEGKVCDCHFW